VFDFILRQTYGWGQKAAIITASDIHLATGVNRTHIARCVTKLHKMGLITVTQKGKPGTASYGINKVYCTWKVLPKKVTLPKKVMKRAKLLPKKANSYIIDKESLLKKEGVNFESVLAAWEKWIAYRKDRRLTITDKTLSAQSEFLAARAHDACEIIGQSIKNGWQGLFTLKNSTSRERADVIQALAKWGNDDQGRV